MNFTLECYRRDPVLTASLPAPRARARSADAATAPVYISVILLIELTCDFFDLLLSCFSHSASRVYVFLSLWLPVPLQSMKAQLNIYASLPSVSVSLLSAPTGCSHM